MQFVLAYWPFLPKEFACIQFGSSSKCQIGPFCATLSIYDPRGRKGANVENIIFGKPHLKIWIHHMRLTNMLNTVLSYDFNSVECNQSASMVCHRENALYYVGWWKKSRKLWASGKGMYNWRWIITYRTNHLTSMGGLWCWWGGGAVWVQFMLSIWFTAA